MSCVFHSFSVFMGAGCVQIDIVLLFFCTLLVFAKMSMLATVVIWWRESMSCFFFRGWIMSSESRASSRAASMRPMCHLRCVRRVRKNHEKARFS